MRSNRSKRQLGKLKLLQKQRQAAASELPQVKEDQEGKKQGEPGLDSATRHAKQISDELDKCFGEFASLQKKQAEVAQKVGTPCQILGNFKNGAGCIHGSTWQSHSSMSHTQHAGDLRTFLIGTFSYAAVNLPPQAATDTLRVRFDKMDERIWCPGIVTVGVNHWTDPAVLNGHRCRAIWGTWMA